jgi:hypothetical protein
LKEVEKAINSLKRKLASLEKQRIELKKKSRLGE